MQTAWTIERLDGAGRPRSLHVWRTDQGRLGLRLPDGESASLDYPRSLDLITAVGRIAGMNRQDFE